MTARNALSFSPSAIIRHDMFIPEKKLISLHFPLYLTWIMCHRGTRTKRHMRHFNIVCRKRLEVRMKNLYCISFIGIILFIQCANLFARPLCDRSWICASKRSDDNMSAPPCSGGYDPYIPSPWSHLISVEVSNYQAECQPWVAQASNRLFFIAIDENGPARPGHQGIWDIYVSWWKGDDWQEALRLPEPVNSQGVWEMDPGISFDRRRLYFARLMTLLK